MTEPTPLTFHYDSEQRHDLMPDELPETIYLVQLAAGAEVLLDEVTGEWVPRAGDPVTVTPVHLERVESDGDVQSFLIRSRFG